MINTLIQYITKKNYLVAYWFEKKKSQYVINKFDNNIHSILQMYKEFINVLSVVIYVICTCISIHKFNLVTYISLVLNFLFLLYGGNIFFIIKVFIYTNKMKINDLEF